MTVQGPDGRSVNIPIWIPLSIMAETAARNAGQSNSVAQAVAVAVIGHGNLIAQRQYMASPNTVGSTDVMGQITMAARRASHALVRAGGSPRAATVVEEAVVGGGALLVPSLSSKEVIRLESRNDTESYHNVGEARGIHDVGTVMNHSATKQVSWLVKPDTFGSASIRTGECTSLQALSGKDIYLHNNEQQEQHERRHHHGRHRQTSQRIESNSTASHKSSERSIPYRRKGGLALSRFAASSEEGSFASEYGGGCRCIDIGKGLPEVGGDKLGGGSTSFEGPMAGCIILDDAADEIYDVQDRTFLPSNLLPHWADSASVTVDSVHSMGIAPLMNLFVPIDDCPSEKAPLGRYLLPDEMNMDRRANSRPVKAKVDSRYQKADDGTNDVTTEDEWTKSSIGTTHNGTYLGTLESSWGANSLLASENEPSCASYTTGSCGQRTMSTGAILSRSRKVDICDWQQNGILEATTSDQSDVDTAILMTQAALDLRTVLGDASTMGAANTLASITVAEEKTSRLARIKHALGKLNCASKRKGGG